MRLTGLILLVLGLLGAIVGTFSGCGSLFSWNGRHVIETAALAEGPNARALTPVEGRRYTLAVEVVFDREGLAVNDGVTQVEAKLPLVVRVKDGTGGSLAGVTGWLDPNEPPNVLYGQSAREARVMPELRVERLVGPFFVSSRTPVAIDIDLGADRVGRARIHERRLVIHDDALPGSIKRAFAIAALGSVAFVAGGVVLIVGIVRRRMNNRLGRAKGKVV